MGFFSRNTPTGIREKVYTSEEDYSETQTLYNGLNEITLSIDSEGNETHYQYLRTDYLHTIKIDSLGQEEHTYFDLLNRIKKKEVYHAGQLLAIESCQYSPCGNMISHEHEVIINNAFQGLYKIDWEYDCMGHLVKEVEQDEKITQTSYLYGRKDTVTKPDGVALFHSYDGIGRLVTYRSSD